MPYKVNYKDETGYEWSSTFATEEEALAQAAMEAHLYGGTSPVEVVDDTDTVVNDQTDIIAAAEALPD